MEFLKTFFPLSFGAKDQSSLITLIIMCVIGWVVCGVAGWLLGHIPILGVLCGIVLSLAGLYILVTLILGILVFTKVLQD